MSLVTLIVILGGGLFLGILSIVLARMKMIKEREFLVDFVEHVNGLFLEKGTENEKSNHVNYILEHYSEVSRIVGEGPYWAPIIDLGSNLSYAWPLDERLNVRIVAEYIEYNGRKERELKQLNSQRYNPVTLLYRGVELVMTFIFGHIIGKFKPDFDQDRSVVWKICNSSITLFGSIASIASVA